MELNFQVIAGVAAGLFADTSEIGAAKNENARVTPNTNGTNFFMDLNLTGRFAGTYTTKFRYKGTTTQQKPDYVLTAEWSTHHCNRSPRRSSVVKSNWQPQRDSNPCRHLERVVS